MKRKGGWENGRRFVVVGLGLMVSSLNCLNKHEACWVFLQEVMNSPLCPEIAPAKCTEFFSIVVLRRTGSCRAVATFLNRCCFSKNASHIRFCEPPFRRREVEMPDADVPHTAPSLYARYNEGLRRREVAAHGGAAHGTPGASSAQGDRKSTSPRGRHGNAGDDAQVPPPPPPLPPPPCALSPPASPEDGFIGPRQLNDVKVAILGSGPDQKVVALARSTDMDVDVDEATVAAETGSEGGQPLAAGAVQSKIEEVAQEDGADRITMTNGSKGGDCSGGPADGKSRASGSVGDDGVSARGASVTAASVTRPDDEVPENRRLPGDSGVVKGHNAQPAADTSVPTAPTDANPGSIGHKTDEERLYDKKQGIVEVSGLSPRCAVSNGTTDVHEEAVTTAVSDKDRDRRSVTGEQPSAQASPARAEDVAGETRVAQPEAMAAAASGVEGIGSEGCRGGSAAGAPEHLTEDEDPMSDAGEGNQEDTWGPSMGVHDILDRGKIDRVFDDMYNEVSWDMYQGQGSD